MDLVSQPLVQSSYEPALPVAAAVKRRAAESALLALLYAVFVLLVPWNSISRQGFADFHEYVSEFTYYSAYDLAQGDLHDLTTAKAYILSEFLWHDTIKELTDLTGDAATALRIASFFILFIWGYYLFRRLPVGISLLFLLNPMAIDLAMSLIRNGLAWSLVIVALSVETPLIRAALFGAGVLVHTSTLALVCMYYVVALAGRVLRGKSVLVAAIGIGTLIGLALTVGSQYIVAAAGDRRTGADYLIGGGSFLQASIWMVLLCMQCLSSVEYIRRNAFFVAVLSWYETMNPMIPWSYRVWGGLLPPIALSALTLPGRRREVFFCLYVGYLILQFIYWSKLFDYWHLG